MDVARYKLPPCWVPAELLYRAMLEVDAVSGQSRGFLILQRKTPPQQEGVTMCRWLAYSGPARATRHAAHEPRPFADRPEPPRPTERGDDQR